MIIFLQERAQVSRQIRNPSVEPGRFEASRRMITFIMSKFLNVWLFWKCSSP